MKDEIKEILNYLKENDDKDIFGYVKDKILSYEEAQIILDYITNLQEENERLKQSILNAIDKMNSEMVMINDRGYYYTDISALEDILQINDKDFIDYKSRNEKAIEYIKSLEEDSTDYDGEVIIGEIGTHCKDKLLNILNSGDEE